MAEEITVYYVKFLDDKVKATTARLTKKCLFVPEEYSCHHEKCLARKPLEPDGEVAHGHFRTETQALEGFVRFHDGVIDRLQETIDQHERKVSWAQGELAKEESIKRIEVGDVVRDSWGRVGIVESESDAPDDEWLAMQSDPRTRGRDVGERWLTVYPLSGGAAYSAESLTTRLRRPTPEDLKAAGRCPGGFTKDEVAERFPQEEGEQR